MEKETRYRQSRVPGDLSFYACKFIRMWRRSRGRMKAKGQSHYQSPASIKSIRTRSPLSEISRLQISLALVPRPSMRRSRDEGGNGPSTELRVRDAHGAVHSHLRYERVVRVQMCRRLTCNRDDWWASFCTSAWYQTTLRYSLRQHTPPLSRARRRAREFIPFDTRQLTSLIPLSLWRGR